MNQIMDEKGLGTDANYQLICRDYLLFEAVIFQGETSAILSLEDFKIRCKEILIDDIENFILILGTNSLHFMQISYSKESIFEYRIRRLEHNDVEDPVASLVLQQDNSVRFKRIDQDNILISVKHYADRNLYINLNFAECYPRLKSTDSADSRLADVNVDAINDMEYQMTTMIRV